MPHCARCNAKLPDGRAFCAKCGEPVRAEESYFREGAAVCPNCGKPARQGRAFCSKCGAELNVDNAAALQGTTKQSHKTAPEPILKLKSAEETVSAGTGEPSSKPAQKPKPCPFCGMMAPGGSKRCLACGRELDGSAQIELPRCAGCGTILPEGNMFCHVCGKPVEEAAEATISQPLEAEAPAQAEQSVTADTEPARSPAIAEEKPIMQTCTHCGSAIPEGCVFCLECGAPADGSESQPDAAAKPATACVEEPAAKLKPEYIAESVAFSQPPTCPQCGALVSKELIFCEECGCKLT